MIRPLRILAVLGVASLGAGCSGAIDGGGNGGKPGPGNTTPGPSGGGGGGTVPGSNGGTNPGVSGGNSNPSAGMLDDSATVPGVAPLRRLTLLEYQNTVRDLLGIDAAAVNLKGFPSDVDSALSGYVKGGALTTGTDARAFMGLADGLGKIAAEKAAMLVPCRPIPTAASEQDACADKFIENFGLRAFRRPLSNQEKDGLRTLYKAQRGPDVGASFEQAIGALVGGILQTPYFLYHWELGPNAPLKDVKGDPKVVRFNSYEMASRLSYLFWASMPDDKAFEAAAAGKLNSPEEIGQEARRLLADARAKQAIVDFFMQWLEVGEVADLQKDPSFKDYNPAVAQAMVREVAEFVSSIFIGDKADGKLETLLTSPRSYVDGGLAKLYGMPSVGEALKEVDVTSANRAGIFTKGAFLASKADGGESIPPRRGDTVLKRLLCMELVVPPTLPVPAVEEPSANKTTRERYEVHGADACARACHEFLDPVGFAFENFDAVGAYRTMESGKPINATGSFKLPSGQITFKNSIEMVTQLAKAPEAQECMVNQWFRYGLRRHELPTEEKPSITALQAGFKAANHDMRELMIALTKTRAFTHRSLSEGEVTR